MALWMADLLKMFNIDGKVHSIDINPDSIDPEVKKREDIDLIEGDCMKIHESLTDAKMKVFIHLVDTSGKIDFGFGHLPVHPKKLRLRLRFPPQTEIKNTVNM